jgi:hypothetical protein
MMTALEDFAAALREKTPPHKRKPAMADETNTEKPKYDYKQSREVTMGRIVAFRTAGEFHPAMITQVHSVDGQGGGLVNLRVFWNSMAHASYMTSVEYDANGEKSWGGSWCWLDEAKRGA